MIREAQMEDVIRMESILKESFNKFELNKFYQEYNKETVLSNLVYYIDNNNFKVFIKIDSKEKIIGIMILIIWPQLYNNNIMQVQDITIQPNPNLNNIKQAKVLIELIKYMEKHTKEIKAKVMSITINPKYNISNYLKKNKFKNCDNTYIKGVG